MTGPTSDKSTDPPLIDQDDDEAGPEAAGVLNALREAVQQFESKPTVVFASEAERRGLYHADKKKWARRWEKPGPCMYRGCSERSIPRSHTIPSSASIKLIAEKGHVLTPSYSRNGEHSTVDLELIGVNDASTFPGFCTEHERLFEAFETRKEMSSIAHYRLQAFRTICREIYRKRHDLEMIEANLDSYRKRRDDFILRSSKVASLDTRVNVRKIEYQNDTREALIREKLADFRADLADLYRLYDGLLLDIRMGTSGVPLQVVDLPWQVPLALSGIGILRYDPKRLYKLTLCFLAVIPAGMGTKVILGGQPEHWHALQSFLLKTDGPFQTLSLIERFMCRGSDHWFMKPSVWAGLPDARKRAICGALMEFSKSLRYRIPFSIFDGVRLAMIGETEAGLEKLAPSERRSAEKLIQRQKAKLNYISGEPEKGEGPDTG